jgi:hypothetical protein
VAVEDLAEFEADAGIASCHDEDLIDCELVPIDRDTIELRFTVPRQSDPGDSSP